MLTNPDQNIFDWYLFCACSFSDKWVKKIKADLKVFMANREKDALYYDFINWKRTPNEIVVWTMHAYEDISLPKHFNVVFQLDNTDNFVEEEYVIKKVIVNDWMATSQISRGHKHIAILEFSNSVPGIFNLLPSADNYISSKETVNLGLCDKEHFESIKVKMEQRSV